jgi:heme-degrading monooxygenase HmoA
VTGGRIRVLLFLAAPAATVTEAYHRVSQRLAGTPGLARNVLLENLAAPGRFIVESEWDSVEAFRAWEDGPDHREATAPLRPYQAPAGDRVFGVYRVAAEYRG